MRHLTYVSLCDDSFRRPVVVIVEDDPEVRRLLRVVCEAAGYHTETTADGLEALGCLRAGTEARVVVLDYRMPRLDGWGLLRAVAADPELAGAGHAFILLTADAATLPPGFSELLREMGVPVAAKPIDLLHLYDLLAAAAKRIAGDARA